MGLAVSIGAFVAARRDVEQRAALRIQRKVSRVRSALLADIRAHEQLLRAAAGFFAARETVTPEEFRVYVDVLDISRRDPAVRSIALIVPVLKEDLPKWLEERRTVGPPVDVPVTPGEKPDLLLIQYYEPYRAGRKPIGFDVGSVPVNRAAIERARDTGEAALAGPIPLSEPEAGPGLVLQYPIYATGSVPPSLEERRRSFRGCLSLLSVVSLFMEEALEGSDPDIETSLYEGPAADPARLLWAPRRNGAGAPGAGARRATDVFESSGMKLTLAFVSIPSFERTQGSERPFLYLAGGIGMSLLLFGLVWSVDSTRQRALVLAGEMTETLRRSEERNRSVLERMADGLLVVDTRNLAIVDANPSIQKILGLSRAELRERTVYDVSGHETESVDANVARVVEEGAVHVGERLYRRKDGRTALLDTSLLKFRDGEREFLYAFLRDVTEHRELEEQLRQSQKMEAVGTLAGGVAHDFNNILTAVLGYAELLENRIDLDDGTRRSVEEIRKAADRAAALTRQLLAFSRKQILQPRVLDLNEVIRDTERMLSRLLGETIRIEMRLQAELPPVRADATQLQQILLNLSVNARDAMSEGGTLSFTTAAVQVPGPGIPVAPKFEAGLYVLLSVTDTGLGMDEEAKARVFEPFFTTKERGKGTGLGLPMVYGIVKQSGGFIFVSSLPGKGTTFRIFLPALEEPRAAADSRVSPLPRGRGGTETVLVVEDEEAVRRLARSALERYGYKVLDAGSGEEALRVAAAHEGTIDIAVADIVLPGLDGRRTAEELLRDRPSLKVLYISGYSDNALTRDGVLGPGVSFLEKPFLPETLAQKVRKVLDGRRAGRPADA